MIVYRIRKVGTEEYFYSVRNKKTIFLSKRAASLSFSENSKYHKYSRVMTPLRNNPDWEIIPFKLVETPQY